MSGITGLKGISGSEVIYEAGKSAVLEIARGGVLSNTIAGWPKEIRTLAAWGLGGLNFKNRLVDQAFRDLGEFLKDPGEAVIFQPTNALEGALRKERLLYEKRNTGETYEDDQYLFAIISILQEFVEQEVYPKESKDVLAARQCLEVKVQIWRAFEGLNQGFLPGLLKQLKEAYPIVGDLRTELEKEENSVFTIDQQEPEKRNWLITLRNISGDTNLLKRPRQKEKDIFWEETSNEILTWANQKMFPQPKKDSSEEIAKKEESQGPSMAIITVRIMFWPFWLIWILIKSLRSQGKKKVLSDNNQSKKPGIAKRRVSTRASNPKKRKK